MPSSRGFKDKDIGYNLLGRVFSNKGKKPVKVGIVSPIMHKESKGQTVASIAAKHEFGDGVTERPFMRIALDSNEEQISKAAADLYGKVMVGDMSEEKALAVLGELIKAKMKKVISDGDKLAPVALKPSDKGKKTPLIDTGQMLNSIDYEVSK